MIRLLIAACFLFIFPVFSYSAPTKYIQVDPSSQQEGAINVSSGTLSTINSSTATIGNLRVIGPSSNSDINFYTPSLPINGGMGPQITPTYMTVLVNEDTGTSEGLRIKVSTSAMDDSANLWSGIQIIPPSDVERGNIYLQNSEGVYWEFSDMYNVGMRGPNTFGLTLKYEESKSTVFLPLVDGLNIHTLGSTDSTYILTLSTDIAGTYYLSVSTTGVVSIPGTLAFGDGTVITSTSTLGGGGGIAESDNLDWSGMHSWETPSLSTFTYGLSVGSLTIVGPSTTTAGAWSAREGTGPGAAAGRDILWADSTAHAFKFINNSGNEYRVVGSSSTNTALNLVGWGSNNSLVDIGTQSQLLTAIHESGESSIRGDVTLIEGSNVTLSQSGSSITIAAASAPSLAEQAIAYGSSSNEIAGDSTTFRWNEADKQLIISAGKGGFFPSVSISTVVQSANMGNAAFIAIKDKYLYITAQDGDSLSTFDITDSSNPVLLSQIVGGNLDGAEGLEIAGNYLYVTSLDNNSFTVFDLSNPAFPDEVASIQDATNLKGAEHLRIIGNYAFVANFSSGGSDPGLTVVDISSPTNPTIAATLTNANITAPLYIQAKYPYLYLTNNDSGCKVVSVDISDPLNPTVADSLAVAGCVTHLTTSDYYGRYLYIGDRDDNALFVVDTSTPTDLIFVSSLTLTGVIDPFTLKIVGDKLFATSILGYGLAQFSLKTPSLPVLEWVYQSVDNLHAPDDIATDGKNLYVTTHGGVETDGGFTVINIGHFGTPTIVAGAISTDDMEVTHDLMANRISANTSLNSPNGSIGKLFTSSMTARSALITSLAEGTTSYSNYGSSGTITPNARDGNNISVVLHSSVTVNVPSNAQDFQMFRYRFSQDAAGGREINLGSGFNFGVDVSTWVYSTSANKTDYLGCIYRADTSKCDVVGNSLRGY